MNEGDTLMDGFQSIRMRRHRNQEQGSLRYATICAEGGNDGQALNFFDAACRARRAYEEAKARFQRHRAWVRQRQDQALSLFRI